MLYSATSDVHHFRRRPMPVKKPHQPKHRLLCSKPVRTQLFVTGCFSSPFSPGQVFLCLHMDAKHCDCHAASSDIWHPNKKESCQSWCIFLSWIWLNCFVIFWVTLRLLLHCGFLEGRSTCPPYRALSKRRISWLNKLCFLFHKLLMLKMTKYCNTYMNL